MEFDHQARATKHTLNSLSQLGFVIGSFPLWWNPDKKGGEGGKDGFAMFDRKNPRVDYRLNGHAVITGKKSNITVIDIDDMTVPHNVELSALCDRHCKLIQETKKGRHYFFKYTPAFTDKNSKKLKFDIKTESSTSNPGLIMVAPSWYKIGEQQYDYKFITPLVAPEEMPLEVINKIQSLITKNIEGASKELLSESGHHEDIPITESIIVRLLEGLSQERAEEYDDWIRIGLILKNSGFAEKLYHKFSKRSVLYSAPEVANKWNSFPTKRNGAVTMRTLWWWLKQDNEALFKELSAEARESQGLFAKMVEKFNEEHFFFVPGASVVSINKDKLDFYTPKQAGDTFNAYYKLTDEMFPKGTKVPKFIPAWVDSPLRRNITKMTLKPSSDPQVYSTFKGFGFQAEPEDERDVSRGLELLSMMIQNVCNYEEETYQYVISYFAHMLQYPWDLPGVALVISGPGGIGKDTFGHFIGRILGEQLYANYNDMSQYFSTHDTLKLNRLLIHAEDVNAKITHDKSDELKAIITAENITVNPKGQQPYRVENYARYYLTTNSELGVKLETTGNRRYVLIEGSDKLAGKTEFWNEMYEWLNGPNASALRKKFGDMLMAHDLTGFNVRKIPMTEHKRVMEQVTRPAFEVWFEEWDGAKALTTDLITDFHKMCSDRKYAVLPSLMSFCKAMARKASHKEVSSIRIGPKRLAGWEKASLINDEI